LTLILHLLSTTAKNKIKVKRRTRVSAPHLQFLASRAFSFQKYLNTIDSAAVFMSEGRRVLAGEAILSGAGTIERKANAGRADERTQDAHELLEDLLEDMVRQHSRLVYRIAYAVLRCHHDAEDSTQETFLRVLRYSSKLAEVEDAKTWLARIAWRVAVDRSKQQRKTREAPFEDSEKLAEEVISPDSPADATVAGAQFGATLERLISALPAKLREPLILSTVDEMSPREVAATLGINEAAVRSRVFRARQILREKLEQSPRRK
jgi:RNA polymerase sigma-70 factor (ECF subfamily)